MLQQVSSGNLRMFAIIKLCVFNLLDGHVDYNLSVKPLNLEEFTMCTLVLACKHTLCIVGTVFQTLQRGLELISVT